jgi:hypothetical protein
MNNIEPKGKESPVFLLSQKKILTVTACTLAKDRYWQLTSYLWIMTVTSYKSDDVLFLNPMCKLVLIIQTKVVRSERKYHAS